jgi:diguanylate cyclase (GGDEF)-like protein
MRYRPVSNGSWAWMFLALGTVATAVFLAAPLGAQGTAIYAGLGIGSAVTVVLGIAGNKPSARLPWLLFAIASLFAAAGNTLRWWFVALARPTILQTVLPDLVTIPAYLLLSAGVLGLVRRRQPQHSVGSLADGMLVAAAATMIAWACLIVPGVAVTGQPLVVRAINGIYPVLDILLVYLLARLAFAQATRNTAFRLMAADALVLLVADLGWALMAANLAPWAKPWMFSGQYCLSLLLVGVAALHPSMQVLTEPLPRQVHKLRSWRLAAVASTLLVPAALALIRPPNSAADKIVFAGGTVVLVIAVLWRMVRAVADNANSEAVLAHKASHDELTGLPNRAALSARLTEEVELIDSGLLVPPWAVLFMDLDGFKVINDTWGHATGDELLVAVARRLSGAMPLGSMVARVGGDEFLAVCPADMALEIGGRLLAAFTNPFALSIGAAFITTSIGIAIPEGADGHSSPEDLIRDADTAMYRAKDHGRNQCMVFDTEMSLRVARRQRLELSLRTILERDELTLNYQPVVDLVTAEVVGFEALIRWNHPDWGMISPVEFIPIAEETGLIVGIGRWVLHTACAQLAAFDAAGGMGRGLWMAVNVSARQLRTQGIVDDVAEALALSRIEPSRLCVEITETVMVDDAAEATRALNAIKDLGATLAADDFGTGYSSLAYLRRYPVDKVKIDKSFVDGLGNSADDVVIINAVLAMAAALNLEVVAEGVETLTQRRLLVELGCRLAQGFLFSKPLSATDSIKLVACGLPTADQLRPDSKTMLDRVRQIAAVPA